MQVRICGTRKQCGKSEASARRKMHRQQNEEQDMPKVRIRGGRQVRIRAVGAHEAVPRTKGEKDRLEKDAGGRVENKRERGHTFSEQ